VRVGLDFMQNDRILPVTRVCTAGDALVLWGLGSGLWWVCIAGFYVVRFEVLVACDWGCGFCRPRAIVPGRGGEIVILTVRTG